MYAIKFVIFFNLQTVTLKYKKIENVSICFKRKPLGIYMTYNTSVPLKTTDKKYLKSSPWV